MTIDPFTQKYVNKGVLKYTYSLVAGINRQMIYTRQQNDMCDLFPKITIKHTGKIILLLTTPMGAQWLSGRVFDSRPRGRGFEHHRLQCDVLFVCFVALRHKSTAMVIAGRSVHLTTLFFLGKLEQAINQLSCTYFRL